METKAQWHVGYWLVALMLIMAFQYFWGAATVEPLPYSDFEKYLAEGRIAEVVVSEHQLVGKLKVAEGKKTTVVAARVDPQMAERLARYNVKYTQAVESTYLRDLISWTAPAVAFL